MHSKRLQLAVIINSLIILLSKSSIQYQSGTIYPPPTQSLYFGSENLNRPPIVYNTPSLPPMPPLIPVPFQNQQSKRIQSVNRRIRQSDYITERPLVLFDQKLHSIPQKYSDNAPGAYSWGYSWIDQFGNQMFREENSDGRGTVWGRYSFRNYDGILRIVEYVADHNGYRTRIRSNEPGVVTSYPAGAEILRFDDENNIPDRRYYK